MTSGRRPSYRRYLNAREQHRFRFRKHEARTYLRMYIRLWCLECCRGSDGRSKGGLARVEHWARVRLPGTLAVSSATTSRRKDAAIVAAALDGAADEQCSRAENVVSVEKAPDPASGGGDAA